MLPPVSSSVISLPIFYCAIWYIWFFISLKPLSNYFKSCCLSCMRPIITPFFCSISFWKVSSSMSSSGLLVRLFGPNVHIWLNSDLNSLDMCYLSSISRYNSCSFFYSLLYWWSSLLIRSFLQIFKIFIIFDVFLYIVLILML